MKIYLYMKVRYYLPMFEYGKIKRILLVFYRENNQIKENKFFILCMGCSHSFSISQQQDQNFFVKMFTEDQYIDKMLCLILQNDQFRVLIEKQIMQDLKAQLKQIYWAETDKQNLARQLQQHIRYSVQLIDKKKNPKVKVTVQEYGKKFGKDIYTLKQSVQSKNKQMLNSLKFYDEIFKNYQMQFIWLQKKQQTQQAQALYSKQIDELNSMAQQVMNMSESCQQLYFYFSWYLVRGCRKLQQRKDIAQDQKIYKINKILQIILEYINIQYMQTPNSNLKQIQYLFFYQQEDLLQKIQCKVYSNKYLKFQIKGSPQQKQKQLENKIMEMAIQAKKQQHYFGNFLSQICKEQHGYHFKKGLKIKSQENKQAINRVKQKILFSQNNSHKKDENLDYQSIDELIESQRNKKVEEFYKILEQNDTITLRISDLLRARCMFSKIQSINNTTQKIMNKVKKLRSEGQDIEIIQIDNRLKKLTNDMVIKIRIKNVITQFQLMFNNPKCTAKEIYHRAYEISRSKIVSSIFMLFDWHEKLTKRYISFLDNLFNHEHSQKVLTLDQKRIYQQIRKQSQYDKLVQKNPTIPDHQKQKIKNDITSLIFLNSVIDYMKVENLLKKVQERTSDYYFENKQFNKSKKYLLKQYEKQKQSEQKKRILIKKQTIQTVWTRLSTSDRNDSRHSTGNREIESPTFKKTNEKFIIK